jgi:hypothetical protein
MNPNGTPKNLRPPWRKGTPSPNSTGRPHRLPISDTYESLADEPIPDSVRKIMKRNGVPLAPGATFAVALALRVWMRALNGDPVAAKEVRESMEGKAAQRTVAVNDGPVSLRVVFPKENGKEPPDSAPASVPDK